MTEPRTQSGRALDARLDMVKFLGWLFRDGGQEPPQREYDEVEEALAALVWKHGATAAEARAALLDELEAAMHAHENQRDAGAFPHLGQDNDIRAFAQWLVDYIEYQR